MADEKMINLGHAKTIMQEVDDRFIDETELEERLEDVGSGGGQRTIMSETEPEDLQTDEFWDHIMTEIECPDELAPKPATVNLTGTGNTTYCYVTINGTKHYGAATGLSVMPGDEITFGIYGRSTTYYGNVTVNGEELLRVTNQTTQTCTWVVPKGTKTINVSFSYTSTSTQRRGRITVTTT